MLSNTRRLPALALVCVLAGCGGANEGAADAHYTDPLDAPPAPWFRDASSCSGTSGTSGTCCSGASGTSGACSTAADAAPIDAAPCDRHTFTYVGSAASVWVSGDFTSWATDPGEGALVMVEAAGTWRVTAQIGPGRHIYKLIVNGDWIADPLATEQEADGFGGFNSVVEVCTSDGVD